MEAWYVTRNYTGVERGKDTSSNRVLLHLTVCEMKWQHGECRVTLPWPSLTWSCGSTFVVVRGVLPVSSTARTAAIHSDCLPCRMQWSSPEKVVLRHWWFQLIVHWVMNISLCLLLNCTFYFISKTVGYVMPAECLIWNFNYKGTSKTQWHC